MRNALTLVHFSFYIIILFNIPTLFNRIEQRWNIEHSSTKPNNSIIKKPEHICTKAMKTQHAQNTLLKMDRTLHFNKLDVITLPNELK